MFVGYDGIVTLAPRQLPWTLVLVGAVHGYSIPDDVRYGIPRILSALLLGSALWFAGLMHLQRPSNRYGIRGLVPRVLLTCGALGAIPALVFGIGTFSALLPGIVGALTLGVTTLPSALLVAHAHGARTAPRP